MSFPRLFKEEKVRFQREGPKFLEPAVNEVDEAAFEGAATDLLLGEVGESFLLKGGVLEVILRG